jgi:hypothetical protein
MTYMTAVPLKGARRKCHSLECENESHMDDL